MYLSSPFYYKKSLSMIIVDNFLNITSCSMERVELEPRSYDSKDHDFKKINTIMPVTQVSSFERKTWTHK